MYIADGIKIVNRHYALAYESAGSKFCRLKAELCQYKNSLIIIKRLLKRQRIVIAPQSVPTARGELVWF